jgi:hypothetical protein
MSINIPNISIGVLPTAPPPPTTNNVIIINNQPKANNAWDFEHDWHDGIFFIK